MRSLYRLALAFIAPWLVLTAYAQSGPSESPNLLGKGSFEQVSDGGPAGWRGDGISTGTGKENVRSGRGSLRVQTARVGDYFRADASTEQAVPLDPKKLYLVSVWAKGSGGLRLSLSGYTQGRSVRGRSSIEVGLTDKWTECRFYYGPKGDGVDSARFGLSVTGKSAVAYFDDASLRAVEPWRGPGQNLVPNGDMEADSDSDGRPDGWLSSRLEAAAIGGVEVEDVGLGIGPDGSRALVSSCAPPPQERGDVLNVKTWWDWSEQPPPSATWVVPVRSAQFPVEPGRTYEISFQTRGVKVRTFHVKLRWSLGGKSAGNKVLGIRRNGSWPWEEFSMRLTTPSAGVDSSRLEFWARAGSGKLSVDNVSVRPLCDTEGWVEETYEVRPLRAAAEEPAEETTTFPARPRRSVVWTPLPASNVALQHGVPEVALKNGVCLTFRARDGLLYGVQDVRLGDFPLRNPEAPPIAPLILTESGGHYESCRYVGHEVADDGTVTIHTALKSKQEGEDSLDWVFKPIERKIGGQDYRGVAYKYQLYAGGEDVYEVADRASWELGGSALGLAFIAQDAYSVRNVYAITPDDIEVAHAGTRFAHGDGLDYQISPEGALAVFYDEKIISVRNTKNATADWVESRDVHKFASAPSVETPLKCVLFCPVGSHDEWTRVRDYVYGKHAGMWGIRQHTPMPIMNCWMHWRDLARHGDRVLYDIADDVAPKLGELGFKVLVVHGIWSHGGCSPDRIVPAEKYGGTRALKYLCDKAAEHGMIVQAWASTAHLWAHSPLLDENPGWLIIKPDGKPNDGGYADLRTVRYAAGFADYALRQFKKVHDETGLASLWLDSYAGFTHWVRAADRNIEVEQAEELFRYHGKLSQLGYVVYTEATGTFGLPACSFPAANVDSASPVPPDPHTRYGVSNYVGGDAKLTRLLVQDDYYYRLLANKAPSMLYWQDFKNMPEAHEKIARANHDYSAVVDRMVHRHTLADDRGVEWTNPDDATRVLFSYSKARCPYPGITDVLDVTTQRRIPADAAGFTAEPQHTYLIAVEPTPED